MDIQIKIDDGIQEETAIECVKRVLLYNSMFFHTKDGNVLASIMVNGGTKIICIEKV